MKVVSKALALMMVLGVLSASSFAGEKTGENSKADCKCNNLSQNGKYEKDEFAGSDSENSAGSKSHKAVGLGGNPSKR